MLIAEIRFLNALVVIRMVNLNIIFHLIKRRKFVTFFCICWKAFTVYVWCTLFLSFCLLVCLPLSEKNNIRSRFLQLIFEVDYYRIKKEKKTERRNKNERVANIRSYFKLALYILAYLFFINGNYILYDITSGLECPNW